MRTCCTRERLKTGSVTSRPFEGVMTMSKKYTGHCACGAVTYGFDTDPTFIANCHCTDCKRASGGEMATFGAVPDTDFTVFSGNTKSFYDAPNTETCAGQGLDRGLCRKLSKTGKLGLASP